MFLFTSDAELDQDYADAIARGDTATAQQIGDEIISRMSSIAGFLGAVITGSTDFPLYTHATGFTGAQEAQTQVLQSASAIADTAVSAVKWGAAGLVVVGLAAVAVYAFVSSRK